MDSELEEFKRIDLRAYAAALGYTLDRSESWRGSAVMRNANDDKIVVKLDHDGHYVYFSVRDDADNGTIIDFVSKRKNFSLGKVRRELRPWIGAQPPAAPDFPKLEKTGKDRFAVDRAFMRCQVPAHHAYLEQTRRISPALLASPRFLGSVLTDARHNAVFPHCDDQGICGFELKNRNYTGFAKGGEKGLWMCNIGERDNRLVICESGVEALSYAQLFEDHNTRYGSLGGEINPRQPGLIKWFASQLPANSEVIAAMNNDDAGMHLADVVGQAVAACLRSDLSFGIHVPDNPGQDWNEVLFESSSFPTVPRQDFASGFER